MEGGGVDSEGQPERMDAESPGRNGTADEAVIDPFSSDERIVSEAEKRGLTQEQAIEHGREMTRLECIQLRNRRPDVYTPDIVRARIERAGEYAAWEYNGRLAGTIGRRR